MAAKKKMAVVPASKISIEKPLPPKTIQVKAIDKNKTSSSALSYQALLGCILVALLSFIAGILTPSLLSFREARQLEFRKQLNARTRARLSDIVPTDSSSSVTCSDDTLADFLHEEPVAGMHVICVSPTSSTSGTTFQLYPGATSNNNTISQITLTSSTWSDFKTSLEKALKIKSHPNRQGWALFTHQGQRIAQSDDTTMDGRKLMHQIRKAGLILLMEGGQWIWPGVRVGFERTVDLSIARGDDKSVTSRKNATLETLSLDPLVLSVVGFLAPEECDIIQERATPFMRYSEVSLQDRDQGRPSSDFRTSQSTFLRIDDDPTILEIDFRTASLVRIPRSHQEQVQVLRYGNGEKYVAHHDYFDPSLYQNDPSTLATIQNGRNNRLATVFWYLTDVAAGGETIFPMWNNEPFPKDMGDCTVGLKVKPQRGKVIIFYSLKADGNLNVRSLHGACPVHDGIKWAANKWVWNAPMGYIDDA